MDNSTSQNTARTKDPIQLSDHFTYGRLFRFVASPIIMMIFTSIYGVVDGLFVSNYVGKTPFAALNLIMPLLIVLGAVGFMLGTGGTAVVAKTLGMGEPERANEYFSLIIYTNVISGVVLALIGIVFARPVALLLGADDAMVDYCVIYARIVLAALPFFMLQNTFQSFFITAEKPKMGLLVTVIAGVTNMIFDALFIAVFQWGLEGAAIATALSQAVGGIIPLVIFSRKNSGTLHLGKTKLYGKMLLHTCANGSSELMSNISSSVVTMLYNLQLIKFAGEDGVAAYGAIMYVNFIFIAIFIGFAIGSAPVISYHYGADNRDELKSLFKKSSIATSVAGAVMMVVAIALAPLLSSIFVGYDQALYRLTVRGFILYAVHYVLAGFNIFGSSFFTALNNGAVSAIISFLRTLVFQSGSVILLPILFGSIDGVWFSVIVAEVLTFVVTVSFIIAKRKKYGYA